jgi:hypothetical protein
VPGKAGQLDIEIIPISEGEQRIRIRQVYDDVPDRDGKKKALVYNWVGAVRATHGDGVFDKAEGVWSAKLDNPNSIKDTPVYSGTWQCENKGSGFVDPKTPEPEKKTNFKDMFRSLEGIFMKK